jgi:hypothetical protein
MIKFDQAKRMKIILSELIARNIDSDLMDRKKLIIPQGIIKIANTISFTWPFISEFCIQIKNKKCSNVYKAYLRIIKKRVFIAPCFIPLKMIQ